MRLWFSHRQWCCDGLKRAFEYRNRRGIYVYAEPPHQRLSVGVTFWMGMRSIDVDGSPPEFAPTENPTPITVETWYRILFCPWCGCRLERFYGTTWKQLCDADISARHNLDPPPEI